MSNPIVEFLNERKKTRLKKPGIKSDDDVHIEFETINWVGNAAHRAGQLSLVSHPGKFSHPDAKISPLLIRRDADSDGYVRTGDVRVPDDVLGNAAALDVFAFLALTLSDGKTVLQHVAENSTVLRELLGVTQSIFDEWRVGFLKIQSTDPTPKTDGKVKQVYFPVASNIDASGYHLLSVLTPSGLVTENRNRIREMKFSDEAKSARDAKRKNEHSETGLDDVWNLLKVKYGGTQPQNISRLNSSNAGEAWLLPSIPPSFSSDHIRVPKRDFFESLRYDERLRMIYRSLHQLFSSDYNNLRIRDARKHWFESIFDWVYVRVWQLQEHSPGWSDENGVRLPLSQKLWLDTKYLDDRDSNDEWAEEIASTLAHWTIVTYRKLRKIQGDAVPLGDVEERSFTKELHEYTRNLPGDLR